MSAVWVHHFTRTIEHWPRIGREAPQGSTHVMIVNVIMKTTTLSSEPLIVCGTKFGYFTRLVQLSLAYKVLAHILENSLARGLNFHPI